MLYFKFKQSKSYPAAKRGWRGSTLVFFGGFLFCLIFIFMFSPGRTRVRPCLFCLRICFNILKFQTAILFRLIFISLYIENRYCRFVCLSFVVIFIRIFFLDFFFFILT
uniref:(northern house mosquito) hypothetical protein n=1 Tax=Culex pipiens TaxID=7175 RepID=A0A8D8C214_CULPI